MQKTEYNSTEMLEVSHFSCSLQTFFPRKSRLFYFRDETLAWAILSWEFLELVSKFWSKNVSCISGRFLKNRSLGWKIRKFSPRFSVRREKQVNEPLPNWPFSMHFIHFLDNLSILYWTYYPVIYIFCLFIPLFFVLDAHWPIFATNAFSCIRMWRYLQVHKRQISDPSW